MNPELEKMQVMEQNQDLIINDLPTLKAVLIKKSDEEDRNGHFEYCRNDEIDLELFKNFCKMLVTITDAYL